MERKGIILTVSIFILLVVGMFVYAYLKKSELQQETTPNTPEVTETGPYDYIERIDATHFFIDGQHTIVGEVLMPTPCDLLNWSTFIHENGEGYPEEVEINFVVVNNSESCAQVVTPQRFMVDFEAHEDAQITHAHINGRDVMLNLVPAPEGTEPDWSETFIKG